MNETLSVNSNVKDINKPSFNERILRLRPMLWFVLIQFYHGGVYHGFVYHGGTLPRWYCETNEEFGTENLVSVLVRGKAEDAIGASLLAQFEHEAVVSPCAVNLPNLHRAEHVHSYPFSWIGCGQIVTGRNPEKR